MALTPLASGCIAAAAIPVAAGAVMVKSRVAKAPLPSAPAQGAEIASERASVEITTFKELPPPTPAAAVSTTAAERAMLDYVIARQAASEKGAAEVPSALLIRPGDLTARRAPCRSRSLAVFIDLDPGRGTFDPLLPAKSNAALSAALADLRARGIAIVWFSRAGDNFAAPIRQAIVDAGYDRERRDQLVLMRSIDERKQSRRDALADFLCPIALIGDTKADFDELYLYLKNADAALALDGMIGDGWFIVDPFASSDPGAGATPQ